LSTLVGTLESKRAWEPTPVKPLDETIWQAWLVKRAAQDRRSSNAHLVTVKCALVAVLLITAVLWSRLTPYEVVVRFVVAAGAIFLVAQALRARSYALAALFGALVLLYNPVAPMFSFAGEWRRALALASTFPFIASLGWRNERQAHND
jgi:hypothetical protein